MLTFYFSEDVAKLFKDYSTLSLSYEQRETVNKKEGVSAPRIFVQGIFIKPTDDPDKDDVNRDADNITRT